ncbi:MAG: SufS family cysteine desulfurase [Candidatus Kerfeldbacteria bacterium]|nr:SufS family cysteine desulfurase [Candidatus Kerfeldbacteria bacterium]
MELRADFPIFRDSTGEHPLVYLDNAATTQKPQTVINRLTEFYAHENANTHRGLYPLSLVATDAYENARVVLQKFINAPSADEVIFTRGTTEGINLFAYSWGRTFLQAGDEIIVTEMEHHSNIVPWQEAVRATGAVLKWVPVKDGELDLDVYDSLLSNKTKLVAVGLVSNVLGTINSVKEITARAKKFGALVLADGAQAAAHMAMDVQDLGIDSLAMSAHKMYGPTGIGALWVRGELLDTMPAFMTGGNMIEDVRHDGAVYQTRAHKFEAGTMPIAEVIAMTPMIEWIQNVGFEKIRAIEDEVTRYAMEKLGAIDGMIMYGTKNLSHRAPVFPFCLSDVHPHDVADTLGSMNICVRAGKHCANPLHNALGVAATTRASLAIYNTTDDIDRLVEGLNEVKRIYE